MATAAVYMIAASLASAGAAVYSGAQAKKQAKKQANIVEEQGRIAQAESTREAEIMQDENKVFEARQRLAFLKSGISLSGSPLLVLEKTRKIGREEEESVLRRGAAQQKLAGQQSGILKSQGRAALIGGGLSAAGSLASGASQIGGTA